ncbi:MAG: helix-turn-helix transcriptional regulator [Agathobacter sp.]|nr:helix-turn-helix transcriptional regulator [Agathobacter sp.]
MNNVNQVVADNLRDIRIKRCWTQQFVADQLQISQRTISRAETGRGLSKDTMKRLCGLYQVPVSCVYEEHHGEEERNVDLIPDDVALGLLYKHSFISDLQRETIYRFNDVIKRKGIMTREDVEHIIPEVITQKKTYTLTDIVQCCMATNQYTLNNIVNMAL